MPSATKNQNSTGSIFNLGDILGRVVDSGLNAFEQVAPVWLQQQLNLDSPAMTGTNNPTFQNTGGQNPAPNLTTENGVVLSNQTIMLGGLVLGGIVLFALLKD